MFMTVNYPFLGYNLINNKIMTIYWYLTYYLKIKGKPYGLNILGKPLKKPVIKSPPKSYAAARLIKCHTRDNNPFFHINSPFYHPSCLHLFLKCIVKQNILTL